MLAFVGGIDENLWMRGTPDPQLAMLTTLSTEDLIPADHPIRRIRVVVDEVLAGLDDTFEAMYASSGRSSVPPESLLKATVLMAMYSIRSERAFCERLNYDLLFKWFLDLRIDDVDGYRRVVPERFIVVSGYNRNGGHNVIRFEIIFVRVAVKLLHSNSGVNHFVEFLGRITDRIALDRVVAVFRQNTANGGAVGAAR